MKDYAKKDNTRIPYVLSFACEKRKGLGRLSIDQRLFLLHIIEVYLSYDHHRYSPLIL